MKILLALVIGFVSGFGLSAYWNTEREKAVNEQLAKAKEAFADADAIWKKDEEISAKIKIARAKLDAALGIPPEEDPDPDPLGILPPK